MRIESLFRRLLKERLPAIDVDDLSILLRDPRWVYPRTYSHMIVKRGSGYEVYKHVIDTRTRFFRWVMCYETASEKKVIEVLTKLIEG